MQIQDMYVIISCSIQQLYKLFLFRYVSHRLLSPSFIQQSFHFHSWSFNTNNILPAPCHNIYHSTQVYYLYPGHQYHRTQYNFILQDRYQSLMRKVFSLSTTYALQSYIPQQGQRMFTNNQRNRLCSVCFDLISIDV